MTNKRWMLLMGIGSVLALGLITGCTGWSSMGTNMMGGYGNGHGMMGNRGNSMPLTMDQAIGVAQHSMSSYNIPDLGLSEIMEFDNHFYVSVVEKSTNRHAFELLVDRYSGQVHPEPGPNMRWNTKYGHMMSGGMMGGSGGSGNTPSGPMTISPEKARQNAQRYLDVNLPGAVVDNEADAFYGYYTMHILRSGKIMGMLSVNGSTGRVWYHNWHGQFMDMRVLSMHN